MTKDQFDRLAPLELFLEQSTHNYLVNQSMANKQVVFTICKELGIQTGSISCATCVLKAFQRVAELFFKFKAEASKPEPAKPKTKPRRNGKIKD